MNSIKNAYGSSVALTITLASLATSSSLLAGRESNVIDNTTDLYLDYALAGVITTGTSPTANKEIRVYVYALLDDTTYPTPFDGVDSDETISAVGQRDAGLALAAVIQTDNTSDRPYPFKSVSIAALFGGILPKKFGVFVTHNTGVNLKSSGGDHMIAVTPNYQTVS